MQGRFYSAKCSHNSCWLLVKGRLPCTGSLTSTKASRSDFHCAHLVPLEGPSPAHPTSPPWTLGRFYEIISFLAPASAWPWRDGVRGQLGTRGERSPVTSALRGAPAFVWSCLKAGFVRGLLLAAAPGGRRGQANPFS